MSSVVAPAPPQIWLPDYSKVGERLRLPKWAKPWERSKEEVAVAAIAQDSESTVFTETTPGTDGTRSNPSITIVSSTAVAYAIIGCGAQTSASSVTINVDPTLGGTGMTRLQVRNPVAGAVAGTGGQIGIFRLVNPATGSNTLSYGWTGNCFQTWAYIVAYTGVHSTPEVQTIHDAVDSDGGTVTKDITGVVAGNLTLSAWGRGNLFGTVGGSSGATQRFKNNVSGADAMDNGAAASNASASGTVTHSWTSNTGSDRYAVIITEIQAAVAAGQNTINAGKLVNPPYHRRVRLRAR